MFFKPFVPLIFVLHSMGAACQSTKKAINWYPCTQNGSLPLTCGTLTIPLDYTNTTSNATLELQLVKVKALKQPSRGSILFNPGGPGEGGRDWVAGAYAHAQLVATGGIYDLIGFDTRYAQCSRSPRLWDCLCWKESLPSYLTLWWLRSPIYPFIYSSLID